MVYVDHIRIQFWPDFFELFSEFSHFSLFSHIFPFGSQDLGAYLDLFPIKSGPNCHLDPSRIRWHPKLKPTPSVTSHKHNPFFFFLIGVGRPLGPPHRYEQPPTGVAHMPPQRGGIYVTSFLSCRFGRNVYVRNVLHLTPSGLGVAPRRGA